MKSIIKSKVTYGMNLYGSKEINAVKNSLKKTTLMGKNVSEFEKRVSEKFGKKIGVMTNSGSSSNLLTLAALNFKKGSNIITPILTFSTTVAPMVQLGLVPNFVDVNMETLNINENLIEKAINKKTVALMIPNLIGNLPMQDKLRKIANKYKIIYIEDSADTIGATYNKKSTGYYADVSTTSFYGSHVISCAGNGGMICLSNKKLAEKITLLRSWGRSSSLYKDSEKIENRFNIKIENIPYDKKFVFSEIGYNLEPSEIGAAFGLNQIKNLNRFLRIRVNNFKSHQKFFSKFKNLFYLPQQPKKAYTGWLAYPLIIKENKYFTRNEIQIYLEKNNIQTRPIFTGNILKQPGFKRINYIKGSKSFKNANYIMKNGFMFGLHQGLDKNKIKYIHKKFLDFIKIKKIFN